MKIDLKKDNLLPRCHLCQRVPEGGIIDGFLLRGEFICLSCEDRIINLSENDPHYFYLVQQLRRIVRKHSY